MPLFNPVPQQAMAQQAPIQQAPASQGQQQPQFNPEHYITYHINNFLATPEGKKVIETAFKDYPELKQLAQARVEMHKNILSGLDPKMALDDEHGLLAPPPKNSNPQKGEPMPKNPFMPLKDENGMLG